MADYINKNILFEAYVNIDADFSLVKESDAEAREHLESYIRQRSKHFLDPSIDTTLKFVEGSIKAYATICGSLKSCLPKEYNSFVDVINRLYWFSKRISDAAVMELSYKTNAKLAAITHTEARPGIVGSTKRVLDGYRALAAAFVAEDVDKEDLSKKIKKLRINIQRLFEVVFDIEDKNLLATEFEKHMRSIFFKSGVEIFISASYEKEYKEIEKIIGNNKLLEEEK